MSVKDSDDVNPPAGLSLRPTRMESGSMGSLEELPAGFASTSLPAANGDPKISGERPTVLVVDDDANNTRAIERALADEYNLKFAHCGSRALQAALSDEPPDLILLDIEMPNMSGYDVCSILKTHTSARDIPVIFVTMLGQVHQEARGLELGAADYITKPIQPTILKARVRTHVQLKHRADRLESLACVDTLTELANRRGFDRYLDIEWRRAAREGTDIGLLMIDIDHFKPYHDELGHASADRCMRSVATEIRRCLRRPADFIARYGGEKFAAVLPSTDAPGAAIVGEIVRKEIESLGFSHPASDVSSVITVSVGAASMKPKGRQSMKTLVELVDRRLHEARRSGRNRVVGGSASLRAVAAQGR